MCSNAPQLNILSTQRKGSYVAPKAGVKRYGVQWAILAHIGVFP